MYGLINIAIRDLVIAQFGQAQWDTIQAKAEVRDEHFLRMKAGDDAATYALVGAATEVLGLTASQILQAFGEYWTEFTADEGYGQLMDSAGSTLPEFLQNLDDLHTRVGMMYPDLKPPEFSCEDITEDSLLLHYRSERAGLDDLVIGLLRGLGKRFEITVEVQQLTFKDDGGDSSTFHVSWS
jgi:hypothetical protein